ncbi:hypothetical protein BDV40DRAFT_295603 [Aspergillus tamarii]|uniref:Homeodomain-like protein n=1 Tax=Aspergillus tamarii TaxID=41984 RepID=A0A5N6V8Z7_ASPTM|nr:hypothetical protein BDV40DRAFT_295603 [Aspergillus tamarii]
MPMRWNREEDEILRACVDEYTELGRSTDWNRVAAKLPFRTNKDCRKRWLNHACGSLKKGPWGADEDMALREAVGRHGRKWTLVSTEVGSRSADQCAKRWQHNLDPRLDHQQWTPKEDELLIESVDRYGREWRKIQEKHYSTRSANDLKNRFSILQKRITSRASSRSGLGHHSSSSPVVVSDPSQEGTSPDTNPGTPFCLDPSLIPEEGWEGIYNPEDSQTDVGEIMRPTTNMQQQREQQIRPQNQAVTLPPLTHDDQSMAIDDVEQSPAPSAFSWNIGTTPSTTTGSGPFTHGDFLNSMLSNGLAAMSSDPYHHIRADTGDSNGLGSSSSHVGGPVPSCDTIDLVPDGMKNDQLLSLLTHRASRLRNCNPGGSICIQASGCDREVLNYVLDVLLPIRHLVKMEINM